MGITNNPIKVISIPSAIIPKEIVNNSNKVILPNPYKPTIEFKTNFSRSMPSDSTVTFTKPESSATHDDSLNSYVMYKFNNETEWTVLEADDDGKYKLPLNKVEGASSLRLFSEGSSMLKLILSAYNPACAIRE